MRPPGAEQRDGEVAPGVGAQERDGVMRLAEPDPHPVRELPLERLPPRPIKTDGTNRLLERHAPSFVERRQVGHDAEPAMALCDASVPPCLALVPVAQMTPAACATWPEPTHDADPTEPLARTRTAPPAAKWHSRRAAARSHPCGRRSRIGARRAIPPRAWPYCPARLGSTANWHRQPVPIGSPPHRTPADPPRALRSARPAQASQPPQARRHLRCRRRSWPRERFGWVGGSSPAGGQALRYRPVEKGQAPAVVLDGIGALAVTSGARSPSRFGPGTRAR